MMIEFEVESNIQPHKRQELMWNKTTLERLLDTATDTNCDGRTWTKIHTGTPSISQV